MGRKSKATKGNFRDDKDNNYRHERRQIFVDPMTEGQRKYMLAIVNNRIILCQGPAGTGKTAISIGMALSYVLADNSSYSKIVVMRPVREAGGEHLGFLPGSLSEKMSPWIQPVKDNMEPFAGKSIAESIILKGQLEVIPLAYARGRSLHNSFIILDEAQNCSKDQMKMVLTRLGKGSKLVINGDITQKDDEKLNGLEDAIKRLQGVEGIAIVKLEREDIVRDPLISVILERYGDY